MDFLKRLFNQTPAPKDEASFAWAKDLDGMDDIAAIEFSTEQLSIEAKKDIFQSESIRSNPSKDEEYINAFLAIDEKTHVIVERITTHFINIEHLSAELEERIANVTFLYHRQIYLIYNKLVENLTPFESETLVLMILRAINNATQMIKWRFYNYQSAPANVWIQLSKLYLIAEKQLLLENPATSYVHQEQSTISSAYINACMLGTLESLSFHRKQIDLVSKMLTFWTPKILIQNTYIENKHLFYIDTLTDAAAKRIRNFTPSPNYRYWCFDNVNLKVELCLSLIESNIEPKQQELHDLINNKYALETLETLKAEWSSVEYKRQRRAIERVKTSKYANATYGFDHTTTHVNQLENMRMLRLGKTYQGNKSLDERLASHSLVKDQTGPNVIYIDLGSQQSKIIDESPVGIGMYSQKLASEVSLGMLMGITTSDQKHSVKIGVIRSIKPIVGNELHLGIELLSSMAEVAEVVNTTMLSSKAKIKSDTNSVNTPIVSRKEFNEPVTFNSADTDLSFTCLHLPKEFSVAKQASLIVPRLHYNKNDTYKVRVSGAVTHVKFTETLEYHENWLRVLFTEVPDKTTKA